MGPDVKLISLAARPIAMKSLYLAAELQGHFSGYGYYTSVPMAVNAKSCWRCRSSRRPSLVCCANQMLHCERAEAEVSENAWTDPVI